MLFSRLRRWHSSPKQPASCLPKPSRQRAILAVLYLTLAVFSLAILLLLFRFILVPILVAYWPSFDPYFYDLGVFGTYPVRHYRTFNLTSPAARVIAWNESVCEHEYSKGGVVVVDVHGSGVENTGPMLLDLKGNLLWMDTTPKGHTMNVQLQEWKGDQYLTFWAGIADKGKYFMLDNGFNVARTIMPVGEGLMGDPHEFVITSDDTALFLVYNDTREFDVNDLHHPGMRNFIVDTIIQEVNLETGELLFQWRASDHFASGEYLKYSYDPAPTHHPKWFNRWLGVEKDSPIDYFHTNSLQKDTDGNYLVSIRKTHQVICVSGTSGEILWGLGGRATDFHDPIDEEAFIPTDFKWQHHARWLDQEQGIMTLFDNALSEDHYADGEYSQGKILKVDVANRTTKQLHSYESTNYIRSTSQGSLQYLPGAGSDTSLPYTGITASPIDQVLVGWGSASALTLHDADNENVLCELHWGPETFFFWERSKTYRVFRAPKDMAFRPDDWDPQAVSEAGKAYVSWNGGMEVQSWTLRGRDDFERWVDVMTVPRDGFETTIDLPDDDSYSAYAFAALDGSGNVIRYSNIFEPCPRGTPLWMSLLIGSAAVIVASITYAFIREARANRSLRLSDVFSLPGRRIHRYSKLNPEELGDLPSRPSG